MFTCIIGGFLGSGKTTLLMHIAGMCRAEQMTVALLVNEMGEVGIDGATMKAEGYDAIELPDGCICCSLAGTLQSALKNIDRDIHPDILIIEPTGLALPHKVSEMVHTSLIDSDYTVVIGMVDAVRFDKILQAKREFFERQLFAADFVLVSKCDLASDDEYKHIVNSLKDMYPDKDVIRTSAVTGEGMEEIMRRLRQ